MNDDVDAPAGELEHFVRYRASVPNVPHMLADLAGWVTPISAMARYDAGSGTMIDASHRIVMLFAENGGPIDVAPPDSIRSAESGLAYSIIACEEVPGGIVLTAKRGGTAGSTFQPIVP